MQEERCRLGLGCEDNAGQAGKMERIFGYVCTKGQRFEWVSKFVILLRKFQKQTSTLDQGFNCITKYFITSRPHNCERLPQLQDGELEVLNSHPSHRHKIEGPRKYFLKPPARHGTQPAVPSHPQQAVRSAAQQRRTALTASRSSSSTRASSPAARPYRASSAAVARRYRGLAPAHPPARRSGQSTRSDASA
jgi:hypothetical protein